VSEWDQDRTDTSNGQNSDATADTACNVVPESVSVDIYDQIYTLRGTDAEYIERLAGLVDSKMRAVAAHGGTADSLRVAVLAALNISDELLALRARYDELAGSLNSTEDSMRLRADSLAEMLDEVLEDRRAG
jgi:cell division protein ZapA